MTVDKIAVDARDAVEDLTIEVELTGVRRLSVKVWIAVRLMKLAAFVLGTSHLKVDMK